MQTRELLAAVKAAQAIPSDYRLARFLGVTDNTVSNWQHGRRRPDDAMALRLAELAGVDPGAVLAGLAAERATDAGAAAAWRSVAARLASTAAALLVAFGIGGGPDAHAGQLDQAGDRGSKDYVNCARAAILRALEWFRAWRPAVAGLMVAA